MTRNDKWHRLVEYCAMRDCKDCILNTEGITICIPGETDPKVDMFYSMVFGEADDQTPDNAANAPTTTRASILDAAKAIVCDGRPQEYGGPEDSFRRIAALWSAYRGQEYTAHDVAMMMALLKIARTQGKYNRDNYVDLAGYAACAGEIGGKE